MSEGDQAVAFRPMRGGRWDTGPPDPVLSEESRVLTRLDFSFLFFPVFFQEDSIPEVFLSPGAAKIWRNTFKIAKWLRALLCQLPGCVECQAPGGSIPQPWLQDSVFLNPWPVRGTEAKGSAFHKTKFYQLEDVSLIIRP